MLQGVEQPVLPRHGEDTRRGTQPADEPRDDRGGKQYNSRSINKIDKMRNIWIVNYYSNIPGKENNTRHYEFAKYLTNANYHVHVFFGDRDVNSGIKIKHQKYFTEDYEKITYTGIPVKSYRENKIKRGLSIWTFACKLVTFRKDFEKPDVILFNFHAPFDYPIIWCAKLLKAKLIVEACDLWPEGFVRFGLIKESNPIMKLFYHVERKIYEQGDKIIFSMEGGIDYLRKQGWTADSGGNIPINKISYINNGINLDTFFQDRQKYPTHDKDLLQEDITKVVYVGSIRLVNHVKDLISAAEILSSNNKIKFIIIGDGPDRSLLEQYCKSKNLDNVFFKQRHIPYCEVADIVSHASINVMNYQKDFGKYGISSGKFFQYLAAGKPILCNIKLNYCEINRNQIGIAEDLSSPEKYSNAILQLAKLTPIELNQINSRMKELVLKYDYPKLAAELDNIIKTVLCSAN